MVNGLEERSSIRIRRFAYEDAQEIIEGNAGDYQDEILLLNDLAGKIREQRFANGAVNFESVEVKFQIG